MIGMRGYHESEWGVTMGRYVYGGHGSVFSLHCVYKCILNKELVYKIRGLYTKFWVSHYLNNWLSAPKSTRRCAAETGLGKLLTDIDSWLTSLYPALVTEQLQ